MYIRQTSLVHFEFFFIDSTLKNNIMGNETSRKTKTSGSLIDKGFVIRYH